MQHHLVTQTHLRVQAIKAASSRRAFVPPGGSGCAAAPRRGAGSWCFVEFEDGNGYREQRYHADMGYALVIKHSNGQSLMNGVFNLGKSLKMAHCDV